METQATLDAPLPTQDGGNSSDLTELSSETSKTSEVAILQLVPLSVLLSLYTGWKHLAKHNLCIK